MRIAFATASFGAALLLAACGSDDSSTTASPTPLPGAASTSAAAATASENPSAATILDIRGGRLAAGPDTIDAAVGSDVVLEVTSDEADELHIHGYDRTVDLPAGTPTRVAFTADIPGVFEIELHHSGSEIAQLRVTG